MKIKRNFRGEQVSDIQRRLMKIGYDLGITGPDGVFGPKTERAIRHFQKKHSLPQNGCVDDITWKRLVEESYELGERLLYLHYPFFKGRDVKELQYLLQSLGFNPGALDGVFGPKTEEAVKEFQKSTGLIVDGIVGLKTLEELKRMGAKKKVKITFPRRELKSTLPQGFKVVLDLDGDLNLAFDIGERLRKLLQAHETPVVFTRGKEEVSEEERIKRANKSGGVIFLGLKFILPYEEETGLQSSYFEESGKHSRKGKKLAFFIHREILKAVTEKDLGVKGDSSQILKMTRMPAAVISFFLSSLEVETKFSDLALKQRIAGAILEGIKKYVLTYINSQRQAFY